MHSKWFWLLSVLFLSLVGQVYPVVAQEGDQLVLAFYYAWFDLTTWQKPLSDYPLSPYHSADVTVIEQHVLHAREAGIDALVQAWYGPERKNNQTEGQEANRAVAQAPGAVENAVQAVELLNTKTMFMQAALQTFGGEETQVGTIKDALDPVAPISED